MQPQFDSAAWGPLHAYVLVSPGADKWRVRNDTALQWSPREFDSRDEALGWLMRLAVCRYDKHGDPFEGLADGILLLAKDGLSTHDYGAKIHPRSDRPTVCASDDLTRLRRFGIVNSAARRGGYLFWTLTHGGRGLAELIERYRCRATPSS